MWFKIQNEHVLLNILAKPNAKRTCILGIKNDALNISLHAKPHHNEANKELISFLAKLFRLPKSEVILNRGERSRHKKVMLPAIMTVLQFIADLSQQKRGQA